MKKIKRYFYLVYLVIISICNNVFAQQGKYSERSFNNNQDYLIEYWDTENGLVQNKVVSLNNEYKGYLWINTAGGSMLFDGNKFETIFSSNSYDECFSTFFQDSRDSIWLINNFGKLIRYSNGAFKKTEVNIPNAVTAICENYEGDIIVGTYFGDVYKLSDKGPEKVASVAKKINKIVYENDQLLIASINGLFTLDNGVLFKYKELDGEDITKIKVAEMGDIYCISNGKLCRIDGKQINTMSSINAAVNGGGINDFYIEDDTKMWLGSKNGVFLLDQGHWTNLTTDNGLSSNKVEVIHKDINGNIWIGTENGGLNKVREKRIYTYTKRDGLADDNCRPIIQLKSGAVLIGHWFNFTEWNDGKFKILKNDQPLGFVWSMFEDADGNLWIGTKDEGLLISSNGVIKQGPIPKGNFIPSPGIKSIFQDSKGTYWVASTKSFFTIKNNKVVKQNFFGSATPEVYQLSEDSKGNLWMCTSSGLASFTNGKIKLYTIANGLPNNSVRYIYEDATGTYWIATQGGGISRFNNGVFFNYAQHNPSMNLVTSCIIEDDKGYLWISTNNGIYSAKKSELNDYANNKLTFLNFYYHGLSDGLLNTDCNGGFQSSGLKLKSGYICFPTEGGIAVINPNVVSRENVVSEPVIESVTNNNKLTTVTDTLQNLGSITGNITFNFTAPFFGEQKNLKFQYLLDGFSKNWSIPGPERSVGFLELPPGDYVFRIRVYGSLNEKKLQFNVPLPFWRTTTFYIFSALSLLSVLFLVIYIRIRLVKKRANENLLNVKRFTELELKALQGQMNPHFLFNCLNTIKYFIETDDKKSAGEYLGKFSKMIRLFLEQSNSSTITLNEELNLLSLYVEMEQLRVDMAFRFVLEKNQIDGIDQIQIPTMLLQPFVENAIHHGLRAIERPGLLKISVNLIANVLQIIIEDNGIGRKKSAEKNSSKIAGHKSFGIKNVLERIDALNHIRTSKIELELIDKVDAAGEPSGTRVIVSIPLNNNNNE